jgi:hypothetical protein
MEYFQCDPSMSTDRMYCPSTDEVIFAPHYEEINEYADAFLAYWHGEFLDQPLIKDQNMEKVWEAIYQEWEEQEDPELEIWDLVEKFLKEYDKPGWIVYECTFYGMACGPVQTTVYYVVKEDTVIEEDPDYEEDYDDDYEDREDEETPDDENENAD